MLLPCLQHYTTYTSGVLTRNNVTSLSNEQFTSVVAKEDAKIKSEQNAEVRAANPHQTETPAALLIYTNFHRPGTWTSTASLPTASMRRRWTPCSHRGSTRCRTWLRTSMVRTISRSLLSHDSSRRRSLAHPFTRPLALSGASSLTPALAASSSAPPPSSVRVPQYPGGPAASKGGASRGDPSNTKQMTEQQVRLLPFGRLLLLVQ